MSVIEHLEKRLVRGPNVTQLMPAKYPWAWEWYIDSNKNHWTPGEIQMGKDIYQFQHSLTDSERHVFTNVFAYLTTSDVLAMRNVSLAVMEKITAPEVQISLMRHGFDESIHCYIDGTEILTSAGYKDFCDLKLTDRVAQYNTDGSITFIEPLEILHDKYNGKMYEFYNDSGTYLSVVTPDHRCVAINPRKQNQIEIIKAADFNVVNYNIPVSGNLHNQAADKFTALDSIRIAYQADGTLANSHVLHTGKVTGKRVIRFHLVQKRKKDRIIELVKEAGLEYKIKEYNQSGATLSRALIWVWIPADLIIDKSFDWVDISRIDSSWINSFFDELGKWDGCLRSETSICYTNTNDKAVQKVMLLTTLVSKRCGIYKINSSKGNLSAWQVHTYNKNHASGRVIKKRTFDYNGMVHCVGVPSGMIVTRYKGRTTISGNTWTYQHCLETLKLDPNDIYTRYLRWPEINAKFELSNRYLKRTLEMRILLTKEDVEEFLYGYIFFCLIFEGVWFYNGFTPIFNLNRRQLMMNAGEQLQYILRDEVNHVKLGIRVIRGIIEEEGIVLDKERIRTMFIEADACEENYIKMILKDGMIGHSVEMHMQQSRVVSNRRLRQLGLETVFPDTEAPFKWLDEIAGGTRKEKNFFNFGDLVA